MLSLAVATALTWTGAGSAFATSALGLKAGGMSAGAAAVGFNTLVTQASVSLVNHQGDVGQAFKDLISDQSIRSLLVAVLTTGADQAMGSVLGSHSAEAIKSSTLPYALKFAGHLKNQLVTNTLQASLSSALEGGKWDRKLLEGVQGAIIGAAAASGANVLGDAYQDGVLQDNWLGHKAAHAALGALTAELSGKDVASGAMGAIIGEVIGELQAKRLETKAKNHQLTPEDLQDARQKAIALSRFVAGATVFAMDGDVLMGAQAASNAVENNIWPLILGTVVVVGYACTLYDMYEAYQQEGVEGVVKELAKQGVIQVVTLGAAGAIKGTYKGTKLAFRFAGKDFYTATEVWDAVQKNSLLLRMVVEKAKSAALKAKEVSQKVEQRFLGKGGKPNHFELSGKDAAGKESINLNPKNVALHEKHKVELRKNIGRPHAYDPKLKRALERFHRKEMDCLGSGSTAAAVRHQLKTGELVGGKDHLKKGREAIVNLEKWLKNNPTARANDRAAAENTLKDLKDAFNEF